MLVDPRAGARPLRSRPFARRATSIPRDRRSLPLANLLIGALFVGVAVFVAHGAWTATRVEVDLTGIGDGAQLTSGEAQGRALEIAVGTDDLDQVKAWFNGEPVDEGMELGDGALRWTVPPELGEGTHELPVEVPRMLLPAASFGWSFEVDDTAPDIDVPRVFEPVDIDEPVTIAGAVEPGVDLWLNGEPLAYGSGDDEGSFSISYDHPPAGPLTLAAEDSAGNREEVQVVVPVRYPGAKGVHVTAAAWANDELRGEVMALVDEGLIDTIELDLKDEGGQVGYHSEVPLAREIGAVTDQYDLAETVAMLSERDIRVIGRLVAFRDPVLADHAWETGQRDVVTQTVDGERPYAYDGSFVNPASPVVRQYNLDIAREAVAAGVDDILYDYIPRPGGDLAAMVFPGIEGPVVDAVVSFLDQSHDLLRPLGAYQGASVFGIAASRPEAIAQPVDRFARHTDYLAPMTYPSHWVDGEYRVESPITMPYEITEAALADFQHKAQGSGVAFVPWLQDFTYKGVEYGPEQVRAQIQAAADLGIDNWLLWNASVRYTEDALTPLE